MRLEIHEINCMQAKKIELIEKYSYKPEKHEQILLLSGAEETCPSSVFSFMVFKPLFLLSERLGSRKYILLKLYMQSSAYNVACRIICSRQLKKNFPHRCPEVRWPFQSKSKTYFPELESNTLYGRSQSQSKKSGIGVEIDQNQLSLQSQSHHQNHQGYCLLSTDDKILENQEQTNP